MKWKLFIIIVLCSTSILGEFRFGLQSGVATSDFHGRSSENVNSYLGGIFMQWKVYRNLRLNVDVQRIDVGGSLSNVKSLGYDGDAACYVDIDLLIRMVDIEIYFNYDFRVNNDLTIAPFFGVFQFFAKRKVSDDRVCTSDYFPASRSDADIWYQSETRHADTSGELVGILATYKKIRLNFNYFYASSSLPSIGSSKVLKEKFHLNGFQLKIGFNLN
ncbi:MAG: hypothetical protein Kow00108_20740 [Calditrichia bacterium]